MKKNYWLFLFLIIFAAHLSGIYFANKFLLLATKPLLVVLLAVFFHTSLKAITDPLKKWILAALFFSWLGDIFLMFQSGNNKFFLAGLFAFLFAHIFFIVFFHVVRIRENIKSNWLLLLIVVIYYGTLISFLSPYLDNLKLPVRIYGAILSFMLLLAMHMLSIKDKAAGGMFIAGAFLFVISDSVLAVNKFYMSNLWADIIIMLTYGLAQLFITLGSIGYIQRNNSD